jgi:hypothetical protein
MTAVGTMLVANARCANSSGRSLSPWGPLRERNCAELDCYVAWGVARRGRLFLLGSATLMTKLEEVLGPGVDAT